MAKSNGPALEKKILSEVMRSTWKNGSGSVSTKEIAKALGISEPAIFSHFPTKQKLMDAAFIQAWRYFNSDPLYVPGDIQRLSDVKYELYEQVIADHLKHKKEIVYSVHYIGSVYFSPKVAREAQLPYRQGIAQIIERIYGPQDPVLMDNLTEFYLEQVVRALYHFVIGDIENNDSNRRHLFAFIIGGMKGYLALDNQI